MSILHSLRDNADALRDAPALWARRGRNWHTTSWRTLLTRVRHLAAGLGTLGVRKGQSIGLLCGNREEWLTTDLAAMSLGAVPVGLHTTFTAEQLSAVLSHCEAPVLVVENAELLEKVRTIRAGLPRLRHILIVDGPSIRREGVRAFEEVLRSGEGADPSEWDRLLEQLKPDDLASLAYTFGPRGEPRGVMVSHRNLCWTATDLSEALELGEDDVLVCYLPLARLAERICSAYAPLLSGMQVFFAASVEALPQTLEVARPTVFLGPRQVWESLKERAEESLEAQSRRRPQWVAWARAVSRDRHLRDLRRERPPLRVELQYQAAVRLIFSPMKRALGLDRARLFGTSVSPVSRELLEYFCSIDVVVRELYGLTEVSGPVAVNTPDATRLGTVGQPMVGVEVRVAEDGEVLIRGESVCLGYFADEPATRDLLRDGWLHTGDLGELDGEGFLRIIGRKASVVRASPASNVG